MLIMSILICLIGLDGSGKTTLSNHLIYYLSEKYKSRCRYVWAKLGQTSLSRLFIKSRSGIEKNEENPFRLSNKYKYISYLYLFYILIEHWIRIIIFIEIPYLLNQNIVCDRYYYDSIVDLVLNFDIPYEKANDIFKLLPFIPEPDLTFYIKITPQIAYSRKKDIYSIKYLENRYKIYSHLESDYSLNPLDGTKDIKVLIKEIQDRINYILD